MDNVLRKDLAVSDLGGAKKLAPQLTGDGAQAKHVVLNTSSGKEPRSLEVMRIAAHSSVEAENLRQPFMDTWSEADFEMVM